MAVDTLKIYLFFLLSLITGINAIIPIKLVNGTDATNGIVQLSEFGTMYVISTSYWDSNDVRVVCRQLGFPTKGAWAGRSSAFEILYMAQLDGYFSCYGNETAITRCPRVPKRGNMRLSIGYATANCSAECPDWTYGDGCNACTCNRNGAESCNKTDGTCTCKAGYSGEDCSCSKICNETTSICHTDAKGSTCLCKKGVDSTANKCSADFGLRLIGGDTDYNGRLEVYKDGEWGGVCGIGSYDTLNVICRQLGLPIVYPQIGRNFVGLTETFALVNVSCTGTETSIQQCSYYTETAPHCDLYGKLGIICYRECPDFYYGNPCLKCLCNESNTISCDKKTGSCLCKSGFEGGTCECKAGTDTCDKSISYCVQINGLTDCMCKTGFEGKNLNCTDTIRLVNESSNSSGSSGRVEMFYQGSWGTLSRSGFDEKAAMIVCKQLNLPTKHVKTAGRLAFGPGNDTIHSVFTHCRGVEASLAQCKLTSRTQYGSHNEDVGIYCLDGCHDWEYGPDCKACSCNKNNTASCNPVTGTCNCEAGFEGGTCDCIKGVHNCNETYSTCSTEFGDSLCACKPQYQNNGSFPCQDLLRLEGGSSKRNGKIQVFVDGAWQYVLHSWEAERTEFAKIVCRHLGFPTSRAFFPHNYSDSTLTSGIKAYTASCSGNEATISECVRLEKVPSPNLSPLRVDCKDECDMWQYSLLSMCISCQCNRQNTDRCDKKTGKCYCRPGYEGDDCSCQIGVHTCNLEYERCNTTNGTATCFCREGYEGRGLSCKDTVRIGSNGSVQIFEDSKWNFLCTTENYREKASRIFCRQLGLPTFYIESKLKSLSYREQPQRKTACSYNMPLTLQQCSKTSYWSCSGLNVKCMDDCPDWKYGYKCTDCLCNMNNSISCSKDDGSCVCKAGFEGASCNCQTGGHSCNLTYEDCLDNTCFCKIGYEGKGYPCKGRIRFSQSQPLEIYDGFRWKRVCGQSWSMENSKVACRQNGQPDFYTEYKIKPFYNSLNTTDYKFYCGGNEASLFDCSQNKCYSPYTVNVNCSNECPDWKQGKYCDDCSCNRKNTISCDKGTGKCTCKAGFFGETCDCISGVHSCNASYSSCFINGRNNICLCKKGFSEKKYNCNGTYISLVNGTEQYGGVVQMYFNGSWFLFCDQNWDKNEASVVCRHLGYPTLYTDAGNRRLTGGPPLPVIKNGVKCVGNESTIDQCEFNSTVTGYCYQTRVVAVRCSNESNVRIRGGNDTSGRVEVKINGTWGAVCYSGFDTRAAKIACTQMNLPTFYIKRVSASTFFGTSSGKEYTVSCSYNFRTLEDCVANYRGYRKYCSYSSQAGVVCSDTCPQWKYKEGCTQTCKCNEQTASGCDKRDGNCICKKGFEGPTCECKVGRHSCDTTISACHEKNGTVDCVCRLDVVNSTDNSCTSYLKLKQGSTNNTGNVRLFVNGQWTRICSYSWNARTTRVACRQLGLPSEYVSYESKYDSSIPGTASVSCTGSQSRLSQCSIDSIGCRYNSRDMFIRCGDCKEWYFGKDCQYNCKCNRTNAQGCDIKNGTCICKPGWKGTTCDCLESGPTCGKDYSNCIIDRCVCNEGIFNRSVNCSNQLSVIYYCSFESSTLISTVKRSCNLTNTYNWLLQTSSYSSPKASDGKYALKYSYSARNYAAVMSTKIFTVPPVVCLKFDYYMSGSTSSQYLTVKTFIDAVKKTDVVTIRGNDTLGWKTLYRTIRGNGSTMGLQFTGKRSYYSGKVLIDRIFLLAGECQCDDWYYGNECRICECNRHNSESCDKQNGTCTCKTGYAGKFCDCPLAEYDERTGCKDGIIRLVGGTNATGRVEMLVGGKWSTICDSNWDKPDALVVCKQLGLPTKFVESYGNAKFGRGTGDIKISKVKCKGDEEKLTECPYSTPSYCSHSDDSGVKCSHVCPKWFFGENCSSECKCDKSKSASCDDNFGVCSCNPGWRGLTCGCRSNITCDNSYSYCVNEKCVCLEGFFPKKVSCSNLENVLFYCSFEVGDCNIKQSINDDFDWLRKNGSTPSDNTGPYSAQVGQHYMYLEATGKSTGQNTIMSIKTEFSETTNGFCFQFFYHMRGSQMGTLNVNTKDKKGNIVNVWTITTSQGSSWKRKSMSIPSNATEIQMEGIRGSGFKSDIAVDELILTAGSCVCPIWKYGLTCENDCPCNRNNAFGCDPSGKCKCREGWIGEKCDCSIDSSCDKDFSFCSQDRCICKDGQYTRKVFCSDTADVIYHCSFESDNITDCGITQSDGYSWSVNQGTTSSSGTGPSSASVGNKYIYMEATSRPRGHYATLTIGPMAIEKDSCLTFKYHMYGNQMGFLTVFLIQKSVHPSNPWSMSGEQGNNWKTGFLQLPANERTEIHITGVRGEGYKSDIALDDISIVSRPCECPRWKYGKTCNKTCQCNQRNSFSCDTVSGKCKCKSGWSGDTCDCYFDGHNCDQKTSVCYTENNVRLCRCKDGFVQNRTICQDIDECAGRQANCSSLAKCINTPGSYKCQCETGDYGDGYVCTESNVAVIDNLVKMYSYGRWSSICAESFDLVDAIVACKDVSPNSYGVAINKDLPINDFGLNIGDINCTGNEQSLQDCNYKYQICLYPSKGAGLDCGVCGGVFQEDFGYFSSPTDLSQTTNLVCQYEIRLELKSSKIKVILQSIRLEETIDCYKDSLMVLDGEDGRQTKLLGLCGNHKNVTVTSSTNRLLIRLTTGSSYREREFHAVYHKAVTVMELGSLCSLDFECASMNAICSNESCQCADGFARNGSTSCQLDIELGSNCTRDGKCHIDNAICNDGVCQCDRNFYQNGTTSCIEQKGLEDKCVMSKECQDPASKCVKGLCTCVNSIKQKDKSDFLRCVPIPRVKTPEAQSQTNVATVAGVLIVVFLIIIIAIIIVVFYIRRRSTWTMNNTSFSYTEMDVKEHSSAKTSSMANYILRKYEFDDKETDGAHLPFLSEDKGDIHSRRMSVCTFAVDYNKRSDEDERWINNEFTRLVELSEESSSIAALDLTNFDKNRSRQEVPFDFNRVKLEGKKEKGDNDYINASYIQGLQTSYPFYIASQTPLPATQAQFWRMVWQEDASAVLMLSPVQQQDEYFPYRSGMPKRFGSITVDLLTSLDIGGSNFRSLRLTKGQKHKIVSHFEMQNWETYDSRSAEKLLAFIQLVHSNMASITATGPQIIHCREGTGKTGIYIAVDYLTQSISTGETQVDVCSSVGKLLQNRRNIITSEEEYQFIFECITMYLEKGKRELKVKYYSANSASGESAAEISEFTTIV